jgi:hypothetical protein
MPKISGEPSETVKNGRGSDGRFLPGNRASKGNHVPRQQARFRAALFSAVSDKEVRGIVRKLVEEALAGRQWAVALSLEYLTGGPKAADLEERLFELERLMLENER